MSEKMKYFKHKKQQWFRWYKRQIINTTVDRGTKKGSRWSVINNILHVCFMMRIKRPVNGDTPGSSQVNNLITNTAAQRNNIQHTIDLKRNKQPAD